MKTVHPLLLHSAIDSLDLGIILLNGRGEIVLWNRWLTRSSGRTAQAVTGKTLLEACPELNNSRVLQALDAALNKNLSARLSQSLNKAPFDLFCPAGNPNQPPLRMQQSIHISPLLQDDQQRYALIQIHDVSSSVLREQLLHERAEALRRHAYQDTLTGIPNRSWFAETLDHLWRVAARQHGDIGLIVIDIDHMSKLNESQGMSTGDHCLQAIAACLQKTLHRPEDLLVRYEGDEFIALLPNTPLAGVKIIAQQMLDAIGKLHYPFPQSCDGYVSASMGCASLKSSHELDCSMLLQEAELALFFAKQNGRNQICDSLGPLKNSE
ncbi:GGDEF domain-containing protein [Chitinibacter sp. S2-10]|uniref:GGDEF domain-containing protein n=1 Tax=Chitinibacter sp. S2-10 TaxID=3373597 RepID=UPI0039772FBF